MKASSTLLSIPILLFLIAALVWAARSQAEESPAGGSPPGLQQEVTVSHEALPVPLEREPLHGTASEVVAKEGAIPEALMAAYLKAFREYHARKGEEHGIRQAEERTRAHLEAEGEMRGARVYRKMEDEPMATTPGGRELFAQLLDGGDHVAANHLHAQRSHYWDWRNAGSSSGGRRLHFSLAHNALDYPPEMHLAFMCRSGLEDLPAEMLAEAAALRDQILFHQASLYAECLLLQISVSPALKEMGESMSHLDFTDMLGEIPEYQQLKAEMKQGQYNYLDGLAFIAGANGLDWQHHHDVLDIPRM